MGYLNGILARVGGNLNNNFQKSQMPGGLPGGGMLKLRFDRYIIESCLAPFSGIFALGTPSNIHDTAISYISLCKVWCFCQLSNDRDLKRPDY